MDERIERQLHEGVDMAAGMLARAYRTFLNSGFDTATAMSLTLVWAMGNWQKPMIPPPNSPPPEGK